MPKHLYSKLPKPISEICPNHVLKFSPIFKNITNDADKLSKRIGILNKSFYDIKKDFKNGLGVKNSLFKTNISSIDLTSLKAFNSAIKLTNDGLTKSQRITKAWNENMSGCSIAAKRMGNDLVTGKKNINDVVNATKSATASTKALGVAMNITSNVSFMLAVSAVTKVITELARSQSKAVETSQEATQTYKDEIKEIDDYKQKISELQIELNSGNLSYEDTKTKRSELMTIQDELIAKYGTEKSAIESITAAIGGQVDALDSLNESQYREWLAEADNQTIWNKLTPGGKSGLDQSIDFMESNKTVYIMDLQNANLSDDLQKIQKEIDNTIQSKYNLEKVFATFKVNGTPDEIKSTLESIRQDYIDLSKDDFIKNGISSDLWEEYRKEAIDSINEVITKYDEGIQKHQETYQTYMEGKIKYDSEYSDEYEDVLAKRSNLEQAELSGNADVIKKARQEMIDAINNGILSADNDENVKKYFENLYPELQAEFSSWTFEFNLDANTGGIEGIANELGKKYNATDLLNMINADGMQDGEYALNSLIDKAIEYGVCTDKSAEEVQKLIDLLVELGYVQGEVADVKNQEFVLPSSDKLKQQVDDLNSAIDSIQSAHDTLKSAVEEYNSNSGVLSIDTIQSLMGLSNEYIACLVNENGQLSLNTDMMSALTESKLNEAQATAVSQAMTELQAISNGDAAASTVNYINGNAQLMNSLALLSGSYDGVRAAAMTAAQAQEFSAMISAANQKDAKATANVMTGLNAKLKLIQSTQQKIKKGGFSSVAKKPSSGGSKGKSEEDKEKEYLDAYMNYLGKSLDVGKITYQEYVDKVSKMLDDMYHSGKISAKDYFDYIEKQLNQQLNIYKAALSAITSLFDDEIDKWQDLINGLEDKNDLLEQQKDDYNNILDVVNNVYEKETDKLEEQKQLLQDKIDAINDETDALELQRRKQEALYALERSQGQRSKKVFVEGKGFVFTQDQDGIREAQDNLKDIANEEIIKKLEDEQDALDESIDILQKYRDLWSDVADVYKDKTNEALAIALWGENYEKLILQNRIQDIDTFKNNYVNIQQQIDNNTSMIESYKQKIEYYQALKDQWSSISSVYEEQMNRQYAAMLLGANWESSVMSGRLDVLNNFRDQYIAIQESIANAAWQSAQSQFQAAQLAQSSSGGGSSDGGNGTSPDSTNDNTNDHTPLWSVANNNTNDIIYTGIKSACDKYIKNNNYAKVREDSTHHVIYVNSKGNIVNRPNNNQNMPYGSGTTNAQKGWHEISEQNGDEIVIGNDGIAFVAKGRQLWNFEGGETVRNAAETKEILKNMGNIVPLNFNTLQNSGIMPPMPSIHVPSYSNLNTIVPKNDQPVMVSQSITVTLPNITNETGFNKFKTEMDRFKLDAYQYANKRHK